jgi:hypothetical protein
VLNKHLAAGSTGGCNRKYKDGNLTDEMLITPEFALPFSSLDFFQPKWLTQIVSSTYSFSQLLFPPGRAFSFSSKWPLAALHQPVISLPF